MFNSHRIVLVHQHGLRDVKWKRSVVYGSKQNTLFGCLTTCVLYQLLGEYLTQMLHVYCGIFIRFKNNFSWHIFCIMWVSILKKEKKRNFGHNFRKTYKHCSRQNPVLRSRAQYIKAWSKYLGEKSFAWEKSLFHTDLFLGTNMTVTSFEKDLWPDSHSRSEAIGYNSNF